MAVDYTDLHPPWVMAYFVQYDLAFSTGQVDRESLRSGSPWSLGVVNSGDFQFLPVYSSGRGGRVGSLRARQRNVAVVAGRNVGCRLRTAGIRLDEVHLRSVKRFLFAAVDALYHAWRHVLLHDSRRYGTNPPYQCCQLGPRGRLDRWNGDRLRSGFLATVLSQMTGRKLP